VPGTGQPSGGRRCAEESKLVGINVYEYQAYDDTLTTQLMALATATGSTMDTNGDGTPDAPAVFTGGPTWPSASTVVDAIRGFRGDFSQNLYFSVGDDPRGWIRDVSPGDVVRDAHAGDPVDVVVEVGTAAPTMDDDQFYGATIQVLAVEDAEDEGEVVNEIPVWFEVHPEHR
jgi:hypothetical protein